jgi:hypothetical protein
MGKTLHEFEQERAHTPFLHPAMLCLQDKKLVSIHSIYTVSLSVPSISTLPTVAFFCVRAHAHMHFRFHEGKATQKRTLLSLNGCLGQHACSIVLGDKQERKTAGMCLVLHKPQVDF